MVGSMGAYVVDGLEGVTCGWDPYEADANSAIALPVLEENCNLTATIWNALPSWRMWVLTESLMFRL